MKPLTLPAKAASIVWRDRQGRPRTDSQGRDYPTITATSQPKKPLSVDQLKKVCAALLAEAAATDDPVIRSRLYDSAGRLDIQREELELAERQAKEPAIRAAAQKLADEIKATMNPEAE